MRVRLAFLAFALAGPGVYAQVPAPIQLAAIPGVGPGGGPALVAANTGALTVTAVAFSHWGVATGAPLKSAPISLEDAAWDPDFSPILGGQQVIVAGNLSQDPAKPGPEAVAVIFEDGSSWGDPKWVGRLMQQRTYLLQRLTESLQDLQQAQQAEKNNGAGRAALVTQLQLASNNALATAADGTDRACVMMARQEALVNVRSTTGLSLDDLLKGQIDRLSLRLVKLRSYGNVQ